VLFIGCIILILPIVTIEYGSIDRVGITDCVRYLSHTIEHAVFRIRWLNPATQIIAKSDGNQNFIHQIHSAPYLSPWPVFQLASPSHASALESTNLTWSLGEF